MPAGTPGKTRLARRLLGRLPGGEHRVTDRLGLSYRVPDLREPVAFHLLIDGVYERDVLSLVLDLLPMGGTFVDVGANVGAFALPAACRVGPSGRVLAFEASPAVFPCLRANAAVNGLTNVTAVHTAVCDMDGEVSFYPAPSDHFGMGALAPQFDATPVTVPGMRLDHLLAAEMIRHVDVLKIDVEGFEQKVLEGAPTLLARTEPPVVVFEFCDWAEARVPGAAPGDAQRFLLDRSYTLWRVDDYRRRRPPLAAPVTTGATMIVAKRV